MPPNHNHCGDDGEDKPKGSGCCKSKCFGGGGGGGSDDDCCDHSHHHGGGGGDDDEACGGNCLCLNCPCCRIQCKPCGGDSKGCLRGLLIGVGVFAAAVGAVVLLLWIFYRPQPMLVAVEDASFSNFNFSDMYPTADLIYRLEVSFGISNPDEAAVIEFLALEMHPFYAGVRLNTAYPQAWAPLLVPQRPFGGAGNVSFVSEGPTRTGQWLLNRVDFDKAAGWSQVTVRLLGTVRYRLGGAASRDHDLDVACSLMVRLPTTSAPAFGFQPTDCAVNKY